MQSQILGILILFHEDTSLNITFAYYSTGGTDDDNLTYILATDADVKFTPEDVSALMDLMTRDFNVGAVCGRTRPIGNGPLVWYQIFDYAVGHWFLKAS